MAEIVSTTPLVAKKHRLCRQSLSQGPIDYLKHPSTSICRLSIKIGRWLCSSSDVLESVVEFVRTNENLRHVTISQEDVSDEKYQTEVWIALAAAASSNHRVRSTAVGINVSGVIAGVVQALVLMKSKLKDLSLTDKGRGFQNWNDGWQLREAIESLEALEELFFDTVDDSDLFTLLAGLKHSTLKILCINGSDGNERHQVQELDETLSSLPCLEELWISSILLDLPLMTDLVEVLSRRNNVLKDLTFHHCDLIPEATAMLTDYFTHHPNVVTKFSLCTELIYGGNFNAVRSYPEYFQTGLVPAVVLSAAIRELNLGRGVLDRRGCEVFRDILLTNPPLQILCCECPYMDSASIRAIADGLRYNTKLTSLSLRGGVNNRNNIIDVRPILDVLISPIDPPSGLEELSIHAHGFDDESYSYISTILRNPRCRLRHLSVPSRLPILPTTLLSAANECSTLRSLTLDDYSPAPLTLDSVQDIAQGLCASNLTQFSFRKRETPSITNDLPQSAEEEMLRAVKSNHHLEFVEFWLSHFLSAERQSLLISRLEVYCTRNLVRKAHRALVCGGLPVSSVPRIMEVVKDRLPYCDVGMAQQDSLCATLVLFLLRTLSPLSSEQMISLKTYLSNATSSPRTSKAVLEKRAGQGTPIEAPNRA